MPDKKQPQDAKQDKADRLGQALRENLRKRKAQARVRQAASAEASSPRPHPKDSQV